MRQLSDLQSTYNKHFKNTQYDMVIFVVLKPFGTLAQELNTGVLRWNDEIYRWASNQSNVKIVYR